ncbi:MAG: aminotransferase class I/II-fold pyridoxal phosphate-dependent enzyme, partial [bacterium]|nr:aminotransferase class I/II-fold pyridoxal phosphate-dependent enzyme [bacterium]
EELTQLADLMLKHKNIMVISDEIYEKLIYDGLQHYSIAQVSREIKDRTIIVNGLSKTYSMTGWRIGYLAAPEAVAKAVGTLQSHSTSNPTTFCQTASVTALEHKSGEIQKMIRTFAGRRDRIHSLLSGIKGLRTSRPQGAFYIYPDISGIINTQYGPDRITDDLSFCEILLKQKKVAVIPGHAFGTPNYIRLSFATSEKNIETGVARIREFIQALK